MFNVPKRLAVWQYEMTDFNVRPEFLGGRIWYTASDPHTRLASAKLPHEQALGAIANVDPKRCFLLNPGDEVSVEVRITDDPAGSQKVAEYLTKQLESRGLKVSPGQATRVVATIKPGQVRDMEYRTLGFGRGGFGTQKRKVTEQIQRLAVEYEGKAGWERGGASVMGIATLKQGETVDDAIANWMKNRSSWFMNSKLPEFIPRPEYANGLGKSKLGSLGPIAAGR
jgi:hypothetical protein